MHKDRAITRVAVGVATVIDNFLILQIKKFKFSEQTDNLKDISRELEEYEPLVSKIISEYPEVSEFMVELKNIHEQLWDIETRKRVLEAGEDEGHMITRLCDPTDSSSLTEYLTLSRQITKYNDHRASLKRRINEVTGSEIREVKSHKTIV